MIGDLFAQLIAWMLMLVWILTLTSWIWGPILILTAIIIVLIKVFRRPREREDIFCLGFEKKATIVQEGQLQTRSSVSEQLFHNHYKLDISLPL